MTFEFPNVSNFCNRKSFGTTKYIKSFFCNADILIWLVIKKPSVSERESKGRDMTKSNFRSVFPHRFVS